MTNKNISVFVTRHIIPTLCRPLSKQEKKQLIKAFIEEIKGISTNSEKMIHQFNCYSYNHCK